MAGKSFSINKLLPRIRLDVTQFQIRWSVNVNLWAPTERHDRDYRVVTTQNLVAFF